MATPEDMTHARQRTHFAAMQETGVALRRHLYLHAPWREGEDLNGNWRALQAPLAAPCLQWRGSGDMRLLTMLTPAGLWRLGYAPEKVLGSAQWVDVRKQYSLQDVPARMDEELVDKMGYGPLMWVGRGAEGVRFRQDDMDALEGIYRRGENGLTRAPEETVRLWEFVARERVRREEERKQAMQPVAELQQVAGR